MKISRFSGYYFLFILLLVLAVFLAMIRPFLIATLLAALFAGLIYPLYKWLRRKVWDQPSAMSLLCVCLVLFVIVMPMVFLSGLITVEALQFKDTVDGEIHVIQEAWPSWLAKFQGHPWYDRLQINNIDWQAKATDGAKMISSLLIKAISATGQGAIGAVFSSFIMLYALYFFLIDGPALLKYIKYLSPLKEDYEDRIIARFVSIAKATLKGTILIGIVQGIIGGLTFAICGLGAPFFWGTMMVVASVIPGVGSALIWIPAIIIKVLTGHIGQAVGVLIGGIVIGLTDNLLRPPLIGRDTKMHALMILFSTLGGIGLFGMVGLLLGPILAAIFITLLDIYATEYRDDLVYLGHQNKASGSEDGDALKMEITESTSPEKPTLGKESDTD